MTVAELETQVTAAMARRGIADAADIGWACAWLEACGYPGVKMLAEALGDATTDRALERDAIGIDLANVSCAFLAPRIMGDVTRHGRVFLRNVRHGLYLLPFTVRENTGIGCPVDPAFAVGGARTKNPYAEKLALAGEHGLTIDDSLLAAVLA